MTLNRKAKLLEIRILNLKNKTIQTNLNTRIEIIKRKVIDLELELINLETNVFEYENKLIDHYYNFEDLIDVVGWSKSNKGNSFLDKEM